MRIRESIWTIVRSRIPIFFGLTSKLDMFHSNTNMQTAETN